MTSRFKPNSVESLADPWRPMAMYLAPPDDRVGARRVAADESKRRAKAINCRKLNARQALV
jgi:hypothetical protein